MYKYTIKRTDSFAFEPMEKVCEARDIAARLKEIYKLENLELDTQEAFFILALNNANEVVAYNMVSLGAINFTPVDKRVIGMFICNNLAASVVVAHNHPSGKLKPSHQDLNLTNDIKEIAKLFGVNLLDHIIVTKESYYSFLENNDI